MGSCTALNWFKEITDVVFSKAVNNMNDVNVRSDRVTAQELHRSGMSGLE